MPDRDPPGRVPRAYPRRTVLRALTIGSAGVGLGAAGALAGGTRAGAAPPARTLRAGMSGPDVRELQIRVAGWAADEPRQTFLPVGGTFDAATAAALRRFQHAYGLRPDGVVGPDTRDRLAALATADGSTVSFEWDHFASPDGGGFAGGAADEAIVRERVRQLMYKLEALRHKLGGRTVVVTGGFHSTGHRTRLRGAAGGTHTGGGAADIAVAGLTTYAVYRAAQTCGFSGLGPCTRSWLHCDARAELPTGTDTAFSWADGTVR
jgi:zinc D-Ala-D-Ala carboxypeptidase